jgi:hypothetical protein
MTQEASTSSNSNETRSLAGTTRLEFEQNRSSRRRRPTLANIGWKGCQESSLSSSGSKFQLSSCQCINSPANFVVPLDDRDDTTKTLDDGEVCVLTHLGCWIHRFQSRSLHSSCCRRGHFHSCNSPSPSSTSTSCHSSRRTDPQARLAALELLGLRHPRGHTESTKTRYALHTVVDHSGWSVALQHRQYAHVRVCYLCARMRMAGVYVCACVCACVRVCQCDSVSRDSRPEHLHHQRHTTSNLKDTG